MSNGETVRLDAAAYTQYAGGELLDRERVFDAFFSNLHEIPGNLRRPAERPGETRPLPGQGPGCYEAARLLAGRPECSDRGL